jgi:hypothetical protein
LELGNCVLERLGTQLKGNLLFLTAKNQNSVGFLRESMADLLSVRMFAAAKRRAFCLPCWNSNACCNDKFEKTIGSLLKRWNLPTKETTQINCKLSAAQRIFWNLPTKTTQID